MLVTFSGLLTMQSCYKDGTIVATGSTWNIPVAVAPLNEAILAPATTVNLTWSSTGGATNKWDVYFGEDPEDLPRIATAVAAQTKAVTVEGGKTYYWFVHCVDAATGIKTTSPEFSFTVKCDLNIDNFVGAYMCDEPGYAVYPVTFTKINVTTIENNNFWDSGYVVQYVFDEFGNVTITQKVVNVSTTKTYTINGSGRYDAATSGFYTDYTVVQKVYTYANYALTITPTTVDSNTHTFTKDSTK